MAEFRIALGGVIDAVTTKELDERLTGLQGHIDQKLQSRQTPIRRTLSGSFSGNLTNGVSQVLELGIGRPPMGRIWNVTRITITGNDDHTSVTNLAVAMYLGDPATPMLGQLVIPGIAIPYFNTFSRHALWVNDSQSVFFNVIPLAGFTNQNIVINITVSEFWDATVDQQYA